MSNLVYLYDGLKEVEHSIFEYYGKRRITRIRFEFLIFLVHNWYKDFTIKQRPSLCTEYQNIHIFTICEL